MANPPHLFGADGRLDKVMPHIRPWSVDVVDKVGSDPPLVLCRVLLAEDLGPRSLHAVGPRRGVGVTAPAMEFGADEIAEPVASQAGCRRWLEMVRSTGGCVESIHLIGRSSVIDQGGSEILSRYHLREEAA